MTNTVSFCILDDLIPKYGPVHVNFDGLSYDTVNKVVTNILSTFKSQKDDPTGYYNERINAHEIQEITQDLLNSGYYVWNRFEKYYVIAFALNFTRFEVFSKDCDKELIKWRDNDESDEIKGLLVDDNYNENPVITMMRKFQ